MRVLVAGAAYPPASSGGYELQCAGAVADLRRHGHPVRVLTAGPPGAAREPEVRRELVRFPAVPVATGPAQACADELRNRATLARHLREFAPDVVAWWRMGELSMSLIGRAGVPGVGMVCDPWWHDGPERDPWARLTGAGPDLGAARWLFVSLALRDELEGRGEVVHAGIDLDRLPLAPAGAWRGRLLCAGRLSPLKGADVAVAALAELPEATLELVGDGGSDPAYVETLRAPRVRIEPAAPPEAMASVYVAADAVLFPVRWAEPWGLVPLEAMAVGRPVIATGTGGSAEYLRHEENALVVPPDDPPALAAAVRRLAADPDLCHRLRAGGRATAEAHPADASHARVREALEAAAAAGRTSTARVRVKG